MVFADKMHDIIRVLENDGVIVFPSDTTWGLGCSLYSQKAQERMHQMRGKTSSESFELLCSDLKMLKKYVHRMHPRIETLLAYHERPLTIVYPKARNLPPYIVSENGSAAMRITNDPFSKTIIELLGNPLITTAATNSGNAFPTSYDDIPLEVRQKADYVCYHNRGNSRASIPSVLASYDRKGELIFIRS